MPVITLRMEKLNKALGIEINVEEAVEKLPWLGLDIEEVGEDYIRVEYSPNRMDFSSCVGIVRALKGLMNLEVGLPTYNLVDGEITVKVKPSVSKVRPYIVSAVVKNLDLTEEDVKELMEMQEDLHWGIGRNRRLIAIGLHNLDATVPPFTYTALKPESISFTPLDMEEELTLREILEKHEKGREYGYLIKHAEKYPVILDGKGRVISFPPIINSELTKISEETKNVFIDITGLNFESVNNGLNILVSAMADMGAKIETVTVQYPDKTIKTPNLEPKKMNLRVEYSNKMLGLNLSDEETIKCLKRCRFNATRLSDGLIEVSIPAYRIDILHEIDLVEEVAIGYGYYKLKPKRPPSKISGKRNAVNEFMRLIRQIMIGLGFTEAMNFILTNERIHYEMMRMPYGNPVKLANPVSSEYTMLREMILPSLMKNLSENTHEAYPQKLFEVSDVIKANPKVSVKTERKMHLSAVSAHSTANYTEIRMYLDALFKSLGIEDYTVVEDEHPSFLPGRVASINLHGEKIGLIGEIHPEVLNNFRIGNPVCAFEVELEPIFKRLKGRFK